jgi:carbon-monoxide dehydrogenase medium subunit
MIPAAFDYVRAGSVDEALKLLSKHGDDAKILAGGHSLLPAMKLRLSQPKVVIDIGRIGDLRQMREKDGRLSIGALATHAEIESSDLVRSRCPLLAETAGHIGDAQVRNRGTIGGSLAHADPAADWPAAVLALDAEIDAAGPGGKRTIRARDFFVDMLQSALKPNEILTEIRVSLTAKSVAYAKFAQKASGFAICGVAAVLDKGKGTAAVGVTGVSTRAYRAAKVEEALKGKLTADGIQAASKQAAAGVECLSDIHASAEYREHLATVYVRRALEAALARA